MNKLYKISVFIPLILVFIFSAPALAQYQEEEGEELVTSAVELRGDEEAEAEVPDEILNQLEPEIDIPSAKLDDDSERATVRYINFDNRTPWYVQCFVDGVYQGLVAPYGDLTIYLPANRTYRFYARADFDDGSRTHWGGINRYVSGRLNWQLQP